MESIQYNSINLKVLQNVRWHRALIKDDIGNYLMTRHEIEVICQYQPGMTSYKNSVVGGPTETPGRFPGETDLATLNRLLTPRQLFVVIAGASEVLRTPAINPATGGKFPCDVANGPFCEFVSVPKMIGIRHWVVHVRFLVHTNDCALPNYQSAQDPVLSNTWSNLLDVDDLFYPTKIVSGKAILRTDVLRAQHVTADTLRPSFFFPLQPNYVRENIHVELSPDGATLDWSFTDVGRCYNVLDGSSPIRKAEVFRTMYTSGGSDMRATAESQRNIYMGGVIAPFVPGGAAWGHMTGLGSSIRQLQVSNLPQYKINMRADLWGERNASNVDLTKLSLGICLANVFDVAIRNLSITQGEIICRQELTNRFVSSEVTLKWGDDLTIPRTVSSIEPIFIPTNGINVGGAVIMNSLFREFPTIHGSDPRAYANMSAPSALNLPVQLPVDILTKQNKINPPSDASRSNLGFIETMVVQLLKNPCDPVETAAQRAVSSEVS